MPLNPGTRLGPYEILAPLGAGGMGEVYRARDTRLGRDVAVKVLPQHLSAKPEVRARFEREAKTISSLNHPSICTLFDIGREGDTDYLVMELVEGETLAQRLERGALPGPEVLKLVVQIADALDRAHRAGVIHRDLKPGNVMLTKSGAKLMDFGLAKVEGPSELAQADSELSTQMMTREGVVMGTVPYMSPEQVSGMKVDQRTDIFSLGILAYEMATGRRPFQGRSSAEIASAILRDAPPALEQSRSDLPEGLERVIARCLRKKPDDRFPTAREAAEALRNLSTRPASVAPAPPATGTPATMPSTGARPGERSFWVAVLPFKHRGGEPGVLAVADGLTEDIVTGLSRFSYLRVIARSSTSRYSGEGLDVRSVGHELGARYVMDGSVRQSGSTLRIAVQLVDASSGAHLWAETYNRSYDPDAIFELQDELVPRIVSTVADWYGILPRSMSEAVRSKPVEELSPYEALLRAFGYYWRVTPQEHAAVRPILERAVKEAPGHATAWAMLSMLYGEEHRFGFNVLPDPLGRSLQAAWRAIEAAPGSHVSHLALAQAHYFRKEFEAFRSAAEQALALNPLDGATVEYLAHLLAFAGDWERGCELDKRARLLNPHHPAWYWAVPLLDAYRKGDYQGARAVASKAQMPGQYYSHALFAAVHGQLGEREAASKHVREVLALRPDFAEIVRDQFGKWYLPELVEQLIDGLRKAGLEIPPR